jgi:carbamoyltransferase
MINWGINALNHGSSIAVFDNAKLKLWQFDKTDTLESSTIVKSLHYGAPDKIFWYERPWVKKARQIYAGQYKTALDMSVLPRKFLNRSRLHYAPITYTPHHASHAAAGYYTSPFNHCAIVVLDAIGEFECATIWEGKHGELKKVWSASYPHSLGLFYSAFTKFVGLTPIKDEHLLQKMAEQGDGTLFLNYVRSYFQSNETLELNTNFHRGVLHWDHNELTTLQEQCNLAAAVQTVFEEQVNKVMKKAKDLTNADCLVYMGGCAMNSQANKKVVEPIFEYRWSLPNPGDPSSAIGTVLYHTKQRVWDYTWDPVKHIDIKV